MAEFEQSGLSADRFCAKRSLALRSLRWWRWHLRAAPSAAKLRNADLRLIPVDIVEHTPGVAAAVTIIVDRVELRVDVGADVNYVVALVAALRARC